MTPAQDLRRRLIEGGTSVRRVFAGLCIAREGVQGLVKDAAALAAVEFARQARKVGD